MKLKLIKILAWTGLLGLFAAGAGGCANRIGVVGIVSSPSAVQDQTMPRVPRGMPSVNESDKAD